MLILDLGTMKIYISQVVGAADGYSVGIEMPVGDCVARDYPCKPIATVSDFLKIYYDRLIHDETKEMIRSMSALLCVRGECTTIRDASWLARMAKNIISTLEEAKERAVEPEKAVIQWLVNYLNEFVQPQKKEEKK